MRLTDQDHALVTAAVTEAELTTDGEIVTIVAGASDDYRDVALHWAVLALLAMLAALATWPAIATRVHALVADPWGTQGPDAGALYLIALVLGTLTFLLARFLFEWRPLRLAVTPAGTKSRRVRRRALTLFRSAAEARTRGATGVLLYLSLDEHRAEIVADAAIHSKVAPEVWGAAMAALIVAVRAGEPGRGMAAAVTQIGTVLAGHFPRSDDDRNELPDRLIEL